MKYIQKSSIVIVAILMCIVIFLTGCGNKSELNKNEIIKNEWIDAVGGRRKLTFYKDGTGKYNDYDTKYEFEDKKLNISFKAYDKEQNLVFDVVNEDNSYKFISEDGDVVYIVNDNNFKEKQKLIRTEVSSKTPALDLEQLWSDITNNKANAELKYSSHLYKIKVRVMNINKDYFEYMIRSSNGYMKSIKIYMPTEELAKLSNDMFITVVGQLNNVGTSPVLYNAFVADEYTTTKVYDDVELKKQIDLFGGSGGDGHISWTEGSYPYFINNRDNFEKINRDNFFNELVGTWKAKYYVEDKKVYKITFKSETTADYSEENSNKVNEWKYKINGDTLYFPEKRTDTKYEVRKASENVFIFYTLTTDYVPYWILYKD